jgi:hypothetical protein
VHGLGACDYTDGCSVECHDLHVRLREHECFANYLNGHSYLCQSMEMLGKICDSNLDKTCNLRGAAFLCPVPSACVLISSLDVPWTKRPDLRHVAVLSSSRRGIS